MTIPRMRTINELVREIKEQDPTSAITYNYVRSLCKERKNQVHIGQFQVSN